MNSSLQPPIAIAAFYRFVRLADLGVLQSQLLDHLLALELKGTVLVAQEGINGTIAGDRASIDEFFAALLEDPRFAGVEVKHSHAAEMPFLRTKVKLKKEIVTLGIDVDAEHTTGTHVGPAEWNALIDDPEVLVIDTRNAYEVGIGTFQGALNPDTDSFRDFPAWAQENLAGSEQRPIAMFCTGGIRCEKSTALLMSRGFKHVYQLDGGILNYLAETDPEESRWNGECFVFDGRISVDHALAPGAFDQCHACRRPVSAADKADPRYTEGVSCLHCFEATSIEQKAGFAERQQQMKLAEERGQAHMGSEVDASAQRNKAAKSARHGVGS
ncbi:MAG: hypothetical protein CMQ29_00480 [Gammaproteobacteria bacterium]|nr:hypothetical protein [Gammaproteobacteria bacterium]